MARRTLRERLADLDQPDTRTDEEEIWGLVRAALWVTRIIVFIGVILISEMFDEYFFSGLSLGIWSLIIGIPLFFLLSFTIIMGDSWFAKGEEETAVLRPIRKRI